MLEMWQANEGSRILLDTAVSVLHLYRALSLRWKCRASRWTSGRRKIVVVIPLKQLCAEEAHKRSNLHLTNRGLLNRASEAMEFLRNCGSSNGQRHADNIAILCKRLALYEAKLVQFNFSTAEMLEDAGISK